MAIDLQHLAPEMLPSFFFWLFSLCVALSYKIKIKNTRGDDVPYANENILVCLCTKNILLLKSFFCFLLDFFSYL